MRSFFKNTWFYFLIILSCIGGYFITTNAIKKKLVDKEISYVSNTASEVNMVWGMIDGKLPSKNFWPANTYEKDGMLYTEMNHRDTIFLANLKLPDESIIYYWMVLKKDKSGNETEIWDSGGKEYYTLYCSDTGFFKPGYFIFLAGFIPLLLLYLSHKDKSVNKIYDQKFQLKNYIPQFDSIRAIAVLLVIVHHWTNNKILNFLPNGRLGVNIFFVLSGFLITGILLKAKKQVDNQALKKSRVFRNFYFRRTLRIFPIYYLLLIIFWFLNDPAIKQDGIYYFTYTSNYLFYSEQFFPAHLAHLWSLAVEEQFYLFWPWLIILVPKRYLPYLIGLFFVFGVSSNFIFISKNWWVEIFTPACFDAFAVGGILSFLTLYRQDIIEKIQPKFKWISGGIFILFVLDIFHYSFLPARTSHALLAVTIIYYCLFKRNIKIINFVLDNKWLIKLGKISYGVYLYHLFVPELWMWINKNFYRWGIDPFFNKIMPGNLKPYWLFIQEFSFLMLLCILSWKLIEKPINNLKKRLEYKNKKETSATEMEEINPQVVSF
ncbi:MAG: acyltransferase [Bacteroidia bacterium]|nr:acyltransferase [Bacteroidia bacterium]